MKLFEHIGPAPRDSEMDASTNRGSILGSISTKGSILGAFKNSKSSTMSQIDIQILE
jgi:hypothetical protein